MVAFTWAFYQRWYTKVAYKAPYNFLLCAAAARWARTFYNWYADAAIGKQAMIITLVRGTRAKDGPNTSTNRNVIRSASARLAAPQHTNHHSTLAMQP